MLGFFTVQEVAQVTGLTEAAVRWHCRQGRLHQWAQWTGKFWTIPVPAAADFVAWAHAKKATTSARKKATRT